MNLVTHGGTQLPALGSVAAKPSKLTSDEANLAAETRAASSEPLSQPRLEGPWASPLRTSRCWTEDGTELSSAECGLPSFASMLIEEIRVAVEACRVSVAGESARGKLSLGIEADLVSGRTSAWVEPESTLAKSQEVVGCLRQGLPVARGQTSGRSRYHFAVSFFLPSLVADSPGTETGTTVDGAPAAAPAGAAPQGEAAIVTGDKVRVRRAPSESGEIIGRISPPAQVVVLERKGEWCRVFTPNRNEGWMVCWALGPVSGPP